MKIAIFKLGGRIANPHSSITAFEAVSVSQMFSNTEIGQVDCYTKVCRGDVLIPDLNIIDIQTPGIIKTILSKYDAIVILNGNINYYGGEDMPEQTMIYKIINKFPGRVFYVLIDTLLYPKQIWSSIKNKNWSGLYKEEELTITRTDIEVLTMCYDTDAVYRLPFCARPASVHYFPFEKYAFLGTMVSTKHNVKYDNIYGGNAFRKGRKDKLEAFYFRNADDIVQAIYGGFKEKDFKDFKGSIPILLPKVSFENNAYRLNSSLATVNISDNFNEGVQLNPRVYEAVMARTVSLMDRQYDPQMRAFKDPQLREFLYVDYEYQKKEIFFDKLRKLKSDKKFLKEILDAQFDDSYISRKELYKEFGEFINKVLIPENEIPLQ